MQLRIRFSGFSFQRIHADFKNEILFHKAKRFVRIVLFYSKTQRLSIEDALFYFLCSHFDDSWFLQTDPRGKSPALGNIH